MVGAPSTGSGPKSSGTSKKLGPKSSIVCPATPAAGKPTFEGPSIEFRGDRPPCEGGQPQNGYDYAPPQRDVHYSSPPPPQQTMCSAGQGFHHQVHPHPSQDQNYLQACSQPAHYVMPQPAAQNAQPLNVSRYGSPPRHSGAHSAYVPSPTGPGIGPGAFQSQVQPAASVGSSVSSATPAGSVGNKLAQRDRVKRVKMSVKFSAKKVDRKDGVFIGKSDPYLILKRVTDWDMSGNLTTVFLYRTKAKIFTLNPVWDGFSIEFECVEDAFQEKLQITVMDKDWTNADDEIGSVLVTVGELQRQSNLTLVHSRNEDTGKSSGTLIVEKCSVDVFERVG